MFLSLARKCQIDWTILRSQGRSRLIATSYVWIVVVPILAKVCEKITGHYSIKIAWVERSFDVVLGLPFSWKVFFFMALAFALGKGIYSLKCPSPLQRFETYAEFHARHPGQVVLQRWVHSALQGDWVNRDERQSLKLRFCEISKTDPDALENDELNTFWGVLDLSSDTQRADVFDSLVSAVNQHSPFFLMSAYVSFRIGVALFLWVIAENAWYVIKAVS